MNCHGSELIIKLSALKLGAKEPEMEEVSGELVICEEKLSVSSDVW